MSVLLRAAELIKRPVVTLAGDDIAQIKDVIYSSVTGELAGFTLNGRGVFAGPMRKTLPWENVHGLGPDAVMIQDADSLADRKALRGETEGAGGAVLGSTVITESGRNLGVVTDVILAVGGSMTDAVGYEIAPSDDSAPRRQFVPLPDALSVSGEALMLPDAALEFIRDDLAGFGAAVEEFRARLRGTPTPPPDASLPPTSADAPSEPPTSADAPSEPGTSDSVAPSSDLQTSPPDTSSAPEPAPSDPERQTAGSDAKTPPAGVSPTRTAELPIEDAE